MDYTVRSGGGERTELWQHWGDGCGGVHMMTLHSLANVRQLREALQEREAELVKAGFLEEGEEVTR